MSGASWFSLYDQGFVIETDNQRYVTNFRYEVSSAKSQLVAEVMFIEIKDAKFKNYQAFENQFVSKCGQTMLGFVLDSSS